jgi:sRNA-binding regulator protein Hfq
LLIFFSLGTIRKATADDYDEIMSIYQDEEADYLPDYFHLLLRNPNTTAYVYIINGQIVNTVVNKIYGYTVIIIKHAHNIELCLFICDIMAKCARYNIM